MKRPPELRLFLADNEIIVDNFAGGGGASTGLAAALGIEPYVAINHDAEAIAMHRANHPTTKHYTTDVWEVDPIEACDGKPVAIAWFSPDCTHFSKARGGKPRSQRIRSLSWVAVKWAKAVAPRVICLENVEELLTWGPLHRKHQKDCTKKFRKRNARCRVGCHHMQPIKERAGETWRRFLGELQALGYVVEWKLLRACDFGAPTTRRRLFLVARRDGRPIVWPAPTHGPKQARPFRTAAECIDWTIPCPSIFERGKPLADKTQARIARGVRKYVLEAARPFIVPQTHGDTRGTADARVHSIDEPLRTLTTLGAQFNLIVPTLIKAKTYGGGGNGAKSLDEPIGAITASKRGEFALATASLLRTDMHKSNAGCTFPVETPLNTITSTGGHALATAYLVHRSNGERAGQAPRIYDAEKPLGTIVGQGQKHALCVALLNKHHGGHESSTGGQSVERPIDTITTQRNKSVTIAHLARYNGERREGEHREVDIKSPLPTQDTSNRFALVAAFLARYNGTSTGQAADAPISTIDTTDRFGLVTVTIDGEEYAIVDIGMRMLSPRELYACQGFAADYVIDPVGPSGKRLTKTAQIRMVGNSVPPPAVAAIARAQLAALPIAPRGPGQLSLFEAA